MEMAIGERLKEVRKLLKYSQERFAKEVGISRAHVSNMENGNDNPSPSLVRLICMKYNIDEEWLMNGVGTPTPGWNINTDEGAVAKYNGMRVSFEKKLSKRTSTDLANTVNAFAYLDALLSTGKLKDEEATEYLQAVRMVIDDFEKLTFMVSSGTVPPRNDAHAWLSFKNDCNDKLEEIVANIKKTVNIYLAQYGEEMRL